MPRGTPGAGLVLNAFRHHRGGHESLAGRLALRRGAQRLSASQRWASCHDRRPGGPTVLNAFRHHRGGHACAGVWDAAIGQCSTPFGITEVGISPSTPFVTSLQVCSTPFGITEVGMDGLRQGEIRIDVLNAFRHHRGGHRHDQPVDAAQQCSTPFGITEVGILRIEIACSAQLVLNAFRHHRGGHSRDGVPIASAVLNAFRHHRGGHAVTRWQPVKA